MPGFGCEDFDPSDPIALYGTRPLLMIESKKRADSDMSRAVKMNIRVRKDISMEQVVLPRDPSSLLTELGSGQAGAEQLVDWLGRHMPASGRP